MEKWPFIENWERRAGYDLKTVSEFIDTVSRFSPSFSEEDGRKLNDYFWRSNTSGSQLFKGPFETPNMAAFGADMVRFLGKDEGERLFAQVKAASHEHQFHYGKHLV